MGNLRQPTGIAVIENQLFIATNNWPTSELHGAEASLSS